MLNKETDCEPMKSNILLSSYDLQNSVETKILVNKCPQKGTVTSGPVLKGIRIIDENKNKPMYYVPR